MRGSDPQQMRRRYRRRLCSHDVRGRRPSKIFEDGEQIVALPKHNSVAAAIDGSASLNQVRWQVALKLFLRHLEERTFPQVVDYASSRGG